MSAADMHYELAAKAGRYGTANEPRLECHEEHCGVINAVEQCDCGRYYCNDHGIRCEECHEAFCQKCLLIGVHDQKWRCMSCDVDHERGWVDQPETEGVPF